MSTLGTVLLITARCLQYKLEDKTLERIAEITARYTSPAPAVSQGSVKTADMEAFIDLEVLQEVNEDAYGYIEINGTQISYPVMRSEQPHKYLRRNFYGEPSVYGSIYLDNASYLAGMNMVIYGHNIKSGKMFGGLKRYLDEEFAKEHQEIRFITGDEIRIYHLSAVFQAQADEEALVRNLIPYTEEECRMLADFITGQGGTVFQEFSWGDQLITLVTCEYSNKNGRLFVIGRLAGTIRRKENTSITHHLVSDES